MKSFRLIFKSLVTIATLFAYVFYLLAVKRKMVIDKIIAFGFTTSPAIGIIDQQAKIVAVSVSEGTNVMASFPVITVSKHATISPASGIVQILPIRYIHCYHRRQKYGCLYCYGRRYHNRRTSGTYRAHYYKHHI